MHGFVPRLRRTGLLIAATAALGFATADIGSAQETDPIEPVFIEQPGFQAFKRKVRQRKPIRVAFLGGSITAGATTRPTVDPANRYDFSSYDREHDSWRAQVFSTLRATFETYPKQLKMINAALSSTGSMVGAFRYEADVAAHNPDLLIIEFAINDAPLVTLSSSPEADCSIQRSLLSIIRQAKANNPNIAILMAISPARNVLDNPDSANAISRAITKDASISFGVPYVDVAKRFYEDPLPDGIQRDHLFLGNPFLNGNSVHPSPIGHDVYASAVVDALSGLFRLNGSWLPEPRLRLQSDLLPFPETPRLIEPSEMVHGDGFQADVNIEDWNRHPIFTNKDAMFMQEPSRTLTLPFTGSAAAIWWEWDYAGLPIHGKFELYLDLQSLGVFSSHPNVALGEQRLPRFQVVGEGLDPNVPHVIHVRVPNNQPAVIPGVMNLAMIGLCVDEN